MNKRVEEGRPKVVLPKYTLDGFEERFATEDACKQFLMVRRWPDGVKCPRCKNTKVYKLNFKPWHWQCRLCQKNGYGFSIITGTIFQDTKIPLKVWFKVGYLMLSSKKGMSALQLHRMMHQSAGSEYRTFWYMCHRLRAAMKNMEWDTLMGEVEVDGLVVKSPAKAETKAERADREARERLEHPDMDLFDRFMEKLVAVPKEEIDKLVATPKRGR